MISVLIPAWTLSRASLAPGIKDEGGRAGTSGPQRHRAQSALVTAQEALACVLLIGAGLLVRSFQVAQNIPLGFNPHHLLTAGIAITSAKYENDAARTRTFWDAVSTKVRQLPGVTNAALNDFPPLKNDVEFPLRFTIDGQPDPGPGRQPVLAWQLVSSDYFRTLQVPLLQGRDFNSQDTADKSNVIIVDAALAEHYFPGQNPLGKGITVQQQMEGTRNCTIVGVVPHVRYKSPGQTETAFQAYFPYNQWNFDSEYLILRSDLDPGVLIPAVRKIVGSIDPGVPVYDVSTYDDVIAKNFVTRKLCMMLVTLFSGAALFLSATGLYGILAYAVGQRTREIGIRVALGAQSRNILRLITEQGLKIVCIGLVIGIGAALVAAPLIAGLLYGVSPADPITLGLAILVLGLAGTLACLLPALRAARINPITALRE